MKRRRGQKCAPSRSLERLEERILLAGDTIADLLLINGGSVDKGVTYSSAGEVNPAGNFDIYKVHLDFGDTLTVNTVAFGVGSSLDTMLRLFDSSGNEKTSNDDDPNGGTLDSLITYAATEAGDYFIGVSSSYDPFYNPNNPDSGLLNGTGEYTLDVKVNALLDVGDTLDNSKEVTFVSGEAKLPGQIDPAGDIDLYQVTLAQGETLTAAIEASSFGSTLDSYIRVFDSTGAQVADNDDGPSSLDSELTFSPTTAGTYYIGVSSSYDPFYDPTVANSGAALGTGDYVLKLSTAIAAPPQPDNNDTLPTAVAAHFVRDVPTEFDGAIATDLDVDLYSLNLVAGDHVNLTIVAQSLPSTLDSHLRLFDANGNEITSDDNTNGLDSVIDFTVTATGKYYVGVSGATNNHYDPNAAESGSPASIGDYQLHVSVASAAAVTTEVEPNNTLGTPNAIAIDSPVAGSISTPGDVDHYMVTVTQSGKFTVQVNRNAGSNLDSRVTLYGADGHVYATSDDRALGNTNSLLTAHLTAGTYFLKVDSSAASSSAAATGNYTLTTDFVPATSPFDPQGAGFFPTGIAAGDFNNDGIVDLVTADKFGGTVSVLIGLGDFSYKPAVPVSVGSLPTAVVVADFNHDQKLDLAVANSGDGTISILLGNGDGTFGSPLSVTVGSTPIDLVAADFNKDGKLDLAVLNSGDANVTLLNGDNLGGFTVAGTFNIGDAPTDIAVGNFNGDSRPDLVVANSGSNDVSILINNGAGGFNAQQKYNVGTSPTSLTVAKFNADGFDDIAVANDGSDDVSLLFGKGNGTFKSEVRLDIREAPPQLPGNTVSFVTAADFNKDGIQDLVVGFSLDSRISVALGVGDGTFQHRQEFSTGTQGQPVAAVAADFNHDGRMDFAALNSQGGNVSVFAGLGDGNFLSGARQYVGNDPRGIIAVDVNHDGRLDLISANADNASVLLGRGNATFQDQLLADAQHPTAVVAGDLNHDGFVDLVALNFVPSDGVTDPVNQVIVLLGLGDGTYTALPPVNVGLFLSAAVIGDFNSDGKLDVAVSSRADNTVVVLLGAGDGTLSPLAPITGLSEPAALAIGDFNHDGKQDLAVANYLTGDISILLGNNDGTFAPEIRIATGDLPSALAVADFNGDGIDDLAVANNGSNRVTILFGDLNDLANANTSPLQLAVDAEPSALVAGDFNGDGRADIATTHFELDATTGAYVNNHVSVRLNLGGNSFADQVRYNLATALAAADRPTSLVAGDFNGDGALDLATSNGASGNVTVITGYGDGTFALPGEQGSAGFNSSPVLADVNGDGIKDSIVLDRSGRVLVRLGRSDVKGTFDSPRVVNIVNGQLVAAGSFAILKDGNQNALAILDRAGKQITDGTETHTQNFVTLYKFTKKGMPSQLAQIDLGSHFTQIAAANLNGDGRDDLVGVDSQRKNLAMFVRAGSGFDVANRVSVPVSAAASDLLVANLDGAGGIDMLVADQVAGTLNIVLGGLNANGSTNYQASTNPFATYQPGPAGAPGSPFTLNGAASVAVGDFNEDGVLDVVISQNGANSLGVLFGKGNGGFVNPVGLQTGSKPLAVRVGDFNGDHHADLAVLNDGSNDISIFLGDGHGNFEERLNAGKPIRYAAGSSPMGLLVADVNGDGKADLQVSSDQGDVLNLISKGDGTFKPFTRINKNMSIAVGDLDGDGKPDWIVANEANDRVTVQHSSSNPTFDTGDGVQAPAGVKIADLDGDGKKDMIVANRGGNNVLVYRGLGGGQFAAAKSFNVGTDPIDVQVADMDGDGKLDVIVTNYGSNDLQILFGTGTGALLNARGARVQVGDGPVSAQVVTHPGTNQLPDLLVTNSGSNNVFMLSNVGGGFFNQTPTIFQTGQTPVNTFVGNFNGQMGFVTLNYNSNSLTFYAGFDPLNRRDMLSGGSNPLSAVAADVNSDGLLDLVVGNNGNGVFSVFNGGQDGLSLVNSFVMDGIDHPAALALAQLGQGNDLQLLAVDEGDDLVHVFNGDTINGVTTPGTNGINAIVNASNTVILSGLLSSSTSGLGALASLIGALGVAIEGLFTSDFDTRGLDGGGEINRGISEFFENMGEAVSSSKHWIESTIKDLSKSVGVELKDAELMDAVGDVVSILFPHMPLQAIPALFNNILSGATQVKSTTPETVDQADDNSATESEPAVESTSLDAKDDAPANIETTPSTSKPAVSTSWDDFFAAEASFVAENEREINPELIQAVAENHETQFAPESTKTDRRSYALAAVMASIGAGGLIYSLRRRQIFASLNEASEPGA
jgi:hypothetical protein